MHTVSVKKTFLSTLSLRRATHSCVLWPSRLRNFYPRSPCGERLGTLRTVSVKKTFLSTLSLRRATERADRRTVSLTFLSTLSLRRATLRTKDTPSLNPYFYPRSPCGERPCRVAFYLFCCIIISIHALLAESDRTSRRLYSNSVYFYPRSPCGERPGKVRVVEPGLAFLSTLSLRRATLGAWKSRDVCGNFYPRSPCGERRWLRCWQLAAQDISIHALLAESDVDGR